MPDAGEIQIANRPENSGQPNFMRNAGLLLLAGDGLRGALTGARVGVGALSAHGLTTTMAQAAIAAEVHQTLDVHAGITTIFSLYEIVAVDYFANLQNFLVVQLRDAAVERNLVLLHD